MCSHDSRLIAQLRNRRGIALPLAIFALLILSVLITGVLLTSSTEVALSNAHRNATADLYAAEGAIQAYTAERNTLLAPGIDDDYTAPGSEIPIKITVEREASLQTVSTSTEQTRQTVFSVRGEPVGGGRTVVTMIRVRQQTLDDLDLSGVNAALTLTGDIQVGQNPTTISKTSLTSCDKDPADHAVTRSGKQLISETLGGFTLRDLAWNADIKFGNYFNEPAWSPTHAESGHPEAHYNWGCPVGLGAPDAGGCPDPPGVKIVAIDGQNGTVRINDLHGHGILIVINGSLRLGGSFAYRGLILAERDIQITGAATIEGAVISAGRAIVDAAESADESDSSADGNASIYFNRCALNRVEDAFNDPDRTNWTEPTVNGRTFNWFEVVR